jgi:hypothetical protein
MRKTLTFAIVAAALSVISFPAGATSLLNPSGLTAAAGQLGSVETVARVCRERCSHGVCKKTCRSGRGENFGYFERRHHHHWRERHHHRHHHGVELEIR